MNNFETNSLAKPEILELIDKNKVDKVFFDIDNTVIKTKQQHLVAIEKIGELYGDNLSSELKNMYDWVKRSVDESNYEELKTVFNGKYEGRYWSRELWIVMCSEKLKMDLNSDEVSKIADIYWQEIAKAPYWEDSLIMLDKIKEQQLPIIWVTSGDSNLKIIGMRRNLEAIYDPDYAYATKLKRLQHIIDKYPGDVNIGSTIDKPEIWSVMFDKYKISDFGKIMSVGDSYNADLKNVAEKGGITILIKRN
jgi:FMN phosphatase YigB (HAD superfamily)